MGVVLKNGKEFKFAGRKVPLERGKPIDKEEANNAFKKYKREILDVFFAENGFYKYKTTSYVRLNEAGLLQTVNLQKSQWDQGLFYVNYRVIPLYLPMEYLEMGKDYRLGNYAQGGEGVNQDWHYDNDEAARITFEDICDSGKTCLLPWFDEFCDGENFREMLLRDKDKKWPGYQNGRWLNALERSEEERKAVILENIEKFKLPKKLTRGIFDAEG